VAEDDDGHFYFSSGAQRIGIACRSGGFPTPAGLDFCPRFQLPRGSRDSPARSRRRKSKARRSSPAPVHDTPSLQSTVVITSSAIPTTVQCRCSLRRHLTRFRRTDPFGLPFRPPRYSRRPTPGANRLWGNLPPPGVWEQTPVARDRSANLNVDSGSERRYRRIHQKMFLGIDNSISHSIFCPDGFAESFLKIRDYRPLSVWGPEIEVPPHGS
jgi:hypothetical protein